MMSRKEYMYWQNRKDRVSEYICVRASGAMRAIFGVLNSFTVKKVSFFTIMSNLRLSYLQKVGGMFVQAIPPTQKSGGDTSPHPPPPRDLRQWCTKSRKARK